MNVIQLIGAQRAYFQSGATRSLKFRLGQLQKLAEALESFEQPLLDALQHDLRKSAQQAWAGELGLVASEIRYARRHLRTWAKPKRYKAPLLLWPARGWVRHEPLGVALIMGPWNYPVQLILSPLVGAIAAGNCAVLKPSELAPQTAATIARLIEATFAQRYIAVVQGQRAIAEELLAEKFDKIFFTGSTTVGRAVMTAAAGNLTPVTLELGGKSPCLVCADAPLELSARRIAWGKFLNAGQTCVAPDYVLVDQRVYPAFLDAMRQTIVEFYGVDPQRSREYGRIVNRQHFDRLVGYLVGGQTLCGGQHDADDLYIAPTILTNVPADAAVMQEEIFGPILPVMAVAGVEEAIALLRDRPAPLALYLFTKDRGIEKRVLAETRSGGVCVNDTVSHIIGHNLPFGGLGESGMGAYHGQASFECFSHRRSVLRRSLVFDTKVRYPPHSMPLASLKRAYRFFLRR